MEKTTLHERIESLIEKIRHKQQELKDMTDSLPEIERDIFLADIRSLYELSKKALYEVPGPPMLESIIEIKTIEPASEMPSVEVQEVVTTAKTEEIIPVAEPVAAREPIAAHPNPFLGKTSESSTIATRYEMKETMHDRIAVNAKASTLATKLQNKPIDDLSKAIGVNEKFIFLNELFNGNSEEYQATINAVNQCASLDEADTILKFGSSQKYNWNLKNKYVRCDFMELVQRRFL